ncbi:MAG: hypothetical protein RL189_3346 [Pseudomonadota bacterium]|jgi:ketopantoate reductase
MNESGLVTTHCLVVGGGALGVLLADALRGSQELISHGGDVLLVNRSPLPSEILIVEESDGSQRRCLVERWNATAQECLEKLPRSKKVLFFCVPPEASESVFLEWLAAARATKQQSLQFVFCNNGLLSATTEQNVRLESLRYSFLRAVFMVGAFRELGQNKCRVFWKGGSLVRWAPLSGHNSGSTELTDFWMSHAQPAAAGNANEPLRSVGFLQWQRVDSAHKLEREKFFTNFIIAAVIGPHMQPNKTVFEKFSGESLDLLAAEFALLWKDFGISSESLLENLQSTVRATAENYNSLSLQGANGKNSTMKYFFKILHEELSQQRLPQPLSLLADFIDASAKHWGVTA